jgi:hypothetical protein
MADITVTLPDELAEQAKSAGLLRPESLEAILREAIRQRQVGELFTTMGKLASLQPRLSEAEIDAEVAAARAERASHHALAAIAQAIRD